MRKLREMLDALRAEESAKKMAFATLGTVSNKVRNAIQTINQLQGDLNLIITGGEDFVRGLAKEMMPEINGTETISELIQIAQHKKENLSDGDDKETLEMLGACFALVQEKEKTAAHLAVNAVYPVSDEVRNAIKTIKAEGGEELLENMIKDGDNLARELAKEIMPEIKGTEAISELMQRAQSKNETLRDGLEKEGLELVRSLLVLVEAFMEEAPENNASLSKK